MSSLLTKHDVRILVNDRCDLALSSGAAGVHLGQAGSSRRRLRAACSDRTGSLGIRPTRCGRRKSAFGAPVDYIGFGPVFATATKADPARIVGLTRLKRVCYRSLRPVVAIGGIGLDQVSAVLEAGAASAAVISGLMRAKNLARRMEEFLKQARAKP